MTPARITRRIVCGLTAAAIATQSLLAQHRRVILDDSRVRVTLVALAPGQSYVARGAAPHGSVWVPLDHGVVAHTAGSMAPEEAFIQAGQELVETIGAGSNVTFSLNDKANPARVVIVDVKSETQPPTLDSVTLTPGLEMEDGSARNDTLLIAESQLQLRDVRDIGDEGSPFRGMPHIIRMEPGDVRWIRHGIHDIKNLLPTPAKFTLIEW